MSVVVDTSVWIEFFAGRRVAGLDEALRQGNVGLSPVVAAELMSGAHRERDRAALLSFLEDLPLIDTPLAHWIRVGNLRRRCREKGLSVSTPDAHVAQCALDQDALLLSRDGVFEKLARWAALRVRSGAEDAPA